jgi:hypothetical protein
VRNEAGKRWLDRLRCLSASTLLTSLTAAVLLTACQSSPVLNSQYISPRVKGRVLDAATSDPIRNVSIRRLTPGQNLAVNQTGPGDRALERTPTLRTDADGAFDLDSERDLTLIRRADWYSVTLAFTHKGYERFVTNYTLRDAVIAPTGEPTVDAGKILLRPLSNNITLK